MIQKGIVISISDSNKQYLVIERLDDMEQGKGGWLCVEKHAFEEKGIDNINAFDCWRITDKYLEIQIQRGLITVVN